MSDLFCAFSIGKLRYQCILGFVAFCTLLASSALAFQRPDASHAPMPDYDIRVGYTGYANLQDPRVAEELPRLRNARATLRSAPGKDMTPSRTNRAAAIRALFDAETEVFLNPDATPRQLFSPSGPLTAARPGDAATAARDFLNQFGKPLYRLSARQVAALKITRTQTSLGGAHHVRLQQQVDGIPILGANLKISLNGANQVLMAGGMLYPDLEVSGQRALSAPDAALAAANYVGPRKIAGQKLVPFQRSDWQRVRYVSNWTKAGLQQAKRATGPTLVKSASSADQKSWISRGPFQRDIATSLVVFPLSPSEGRWAWSVSLAKAPTELYQVVIDADSGALLKRANMVKFADLQGKVFRKNPDSTPLAKKSYQGVNPATPSSRTYVGKNASGLQGNNVVMTIGANEKPGSDRDFTYPWQDRWATSGFAGLTPVNLDNSDQRLEFDRLNANRYQSQKLAGAALPAVGADLGLGDDASVCGLPPTGFDYYGVVEPTVCVNSNGNLTFNVEEPSFIEDPTFEFFAAPDGRVMGLWDDLNPAAGGTVSVIFTGDTLCFRWDNVPEFPNVGSNTFGICLFDDSTIRLSYPQDGISAVDGGVGIHPPTRPCTPRGSSSWSGFTGSMLTTDRVGHVRFFPDTGTDMRVSANTVFYHMNNTGHDRQWFQGFDEMAGNFQAKNLGRGGSSCDPIMATVNPPQFFNNAFFGTPPDGTCCPFTSFGKFTTPFPDRESAVDSDVIVHEFGHGITNRIVGGPFNAFALSGLQSGAMGEGWGDFFAFNFADKVVGEYSTGNPKTGIRRVAYKSNNGRSYDQYGNILGPFTFSDFGLTNGTGVVFLNEVHDDGEIWASFLHSVRQKLLAAGRSRAEVEALVVEALHFTPDSPTMLDARNALLVANIVLANGANRCDLWAAAAERGLGKHAAVHNAGPGFPPDISFSVFAAFDRPKGCGGSFARGPIIHQASFEAAAVGATMADGWRSLGPTSLWHVSARRASDGSQSFYYGQEGTGNYDAGRTWGRLRSPVLNLNGVNRPILEFDLAADIEAQLIFDTLWIRITGAQTSGDSQRAVRASPTSDVFFNTFVPQFVHVRVDLSPIGNTATNRIEMYFDTGNDEDNAFEGVYLDNIKIRDSAQN